MKYILLCLASLFFILLSIDLVSSQSNQDIRGLVVLDDLNIRNTHSIFFKSLESLGYKLTFREASDPNLSLTRYGENLYEFLILFAPHTDEFGGSVDGDAILNFIDDGRSVLIATDNQISDFIREIALECGVEFGSNDHFVIDHFNFDVSDFDGDHTLLVTSELINASIITGPINSPLLFRGVNQILEEKNTLLLPILRASPSAYAFSPDDPVTADIETSTRSVLISALQARNNARVLLSGSLEFFSDRFFTSTVQRYTSDNSSIKVQSSNKDVALNLVKWTVKERGLLRSSNAYHHLVDSKEQGSVYCVNDTISFSVDIEEWNGKQWIPYKADDVQLEFVMLDPYYRINLKHDGKGHFTTTFVIPDVYGIYTFKINYNRVGYTTIEESQLVTVRPYRHNEYERFIVAAYPYYASAFSMMFGLFVFGFFFLYSKESRQ